MRILHYIGELVNYKFRTLDGDRLDGGLVAGRCNLMGSNVWKILGFDGKDYRIHGDYLYKIEKGEK